MINIFRRSNKEVIEEPVPVKKVVQEAFDFDEIKSEEKVSKIKKRKTNIRRTKINKSDCIYIIVNLNSGTYVKSNYIRDLARQFNLSPTSLAQVFRAGGSYFTPHTGDSRGNTYLLIKVNPKDKVKKVVRSENKG